MKWLDLSGRHAARIWLRQFVCMLSLLATPNALAVVELRQLSTPGGIVDVDTINIPNGTVLSTQTAPSIASGEYFIGWTIVDLQGGVCATTMTNAPPVRDVFGRALNPVTFAAPSGITANYCAYANYVPPSQRTGVVLQTNGTCGGVPDHSVPDWAECLYYGVGPQPGTSNTDADSYILQDEITANTSPLIADAFIAGGLSEGISGNRFLITDANYYLYHEYSHPINLVPDYLLPKVNGTPITTQKAPTIAAGQYFGAWQVKGVPQYDVVGLAQNPSSFALNGQTDAIALYYSPTDGLPGLPTWYQMRYFSGLGATPTGDNDGDGIDNADELRAGLIPGIKDTFIAGGISEGISPVTDIRLTTLWQYIVQSYPSALVTGINVPVPDGQVETSETAKNIASGSYFSYWDINGAPQRDALGTPLNPITSVLHADTTYSAHYYSPNTATCSGIPDWLYFGYFGTPPAPPSCIDQNTDPDSDGYSIAQEIAGGLSPKIKDTFIAGGISEAISGTKNFDLRAFPRVQQILVKGLPQLFFSSAPGQVDANAFSIGADATPAFGDWDGKGAQDLFVTGAGAAIKVYQNTGSPVIANLVEQSTLESALASKFGALTHPQLGFGDFFCNGCAGPVVNATCPVATQGADGKADVAIGGDSATIQLLGSSGSFSSSSFPFSQNIATGLTCTGQPGQSCAVPAFVDVNGDGYPDLLVLIAHGTRTSDNTVLDGQVRVYPHTGNYNAPYNANTFVENVLASSVPNAVSISTGDMNEDCIGDVVIADATGSLWEFHQQANHSFSLFSTVLGGTYNGYATRASAALVDIDGDGDSDIVMGYAQGGLLYLRNQAQKRSLDPPTVSLVSGSGTAFVQFSTAFDQGVAHGTPHYAFVQKNSGPGAYVDPNSGHYTPGPIGGVVDVIGESDTFTPPGAANSITVTGRSYVNVISPSDATLSAKAIIVAGTNSAGDFTAPYISAVANHAYNTLRFLGYQKSNIRYLSFNTNQDVDGDGYYDDVFALSTRQTVQDAFTTFASSAGNNGKLVVVLVGHGDPTFSAPSDPICPSTRDRLGYFVVDKNGTEITRCELQNWISNLATSKNIQVALIADFCESGGLFDTWSGYTNPNNDLVLTTASTDAQDAKITTNGEISFSRVMMDGLFQGFDVKTAYDQANQAITNLSGAAQYPELNDDNNTLPNYFGNTTTDGTVAKSLRIGPSYVVGQDIPVVERISGDQTLASGVQTASVWIDRVTSVYPIVRSWCVVGVQGGPAATGAVLTDQTEVDLAYNASTQRYEASIDGFTASGGSYIASCRVQDVWGSKSFPLVTKIGTSTFAQKFIIVVGGVDDGSPRFNAANALGNTVYKTALARHVAQSDIVYFNARSGQDVSGDGLNDITGPPSSGAFQTALSGFAGSANQLFVVLISGASTTNFAFLPGDVVCGSQAQAGCSALPSMKAWLDSYQAAQSGRSVDMILEFGDAGTFMSQIAPTNSLYNRFTIAATSAGQTPNALDAGGIVSATQMLMSEVLLGTSLGNAFANVQTALSSTTSNHQQITLDLVRPDLIGTQGYVPGTKDPIDLVQSRSRFFGPGFVSGVTVPQIGEASSITIRNAGSPTLLWASNIQPASGSIPDALSCVWVHAVPLSNGIPVPTTCAAQSQTTCVPQQTSCDIPLSYDAGTQRYEKLYTGFSSGSYSLLVYAQQAPTGSLQAQMTQALALTAPSNANLSPPLQSDATSVDDPNAPQLPVVYFSDATNVVAPGTTVIEQLNLSQSQGSLVVVPIALLGSAADTIDFDMTACDTPTPCNSSTYSPSSVTFAPGQTTKYIVIATHQKPTYLAPLTVSLTLLAVTTQNAQIGNPNAYALTLDAIFKNGFD